MATNPLYQSNHSPNNSTQPTKAVNREGVYVPRTHNTFDMSYPHKTTQRFGFYEPFFAMEGIPGDVIPMSCEQSIQTLPMVSSFKDHVTLNKDYFLVPNQAIQPNTWEYIYKHPAQGDDVPFDAHNLFPLFGFENAPFLDRLATYICDGILDSSDTVLNALLIGELFFSSGSLLHKLGYRISPRFYLNGSSVAFSFDSLFDSYVENLSDYTISVNTDYVSFTYNQDDIDIYTFISLCRQFGSDAVITNVLSDYHPLSIEFDNLPILDADERNKYINMDRLCAYQLSCWQYYVNPQIDFIYNAQLWRDNLVNLLIEFVGGDLNYSIPSFTINGISIPYDRCSLKEYSKVIDVINDYGNPKLYDYLKALFGYNEVLKFGDYFTDSRTRPLAIGNDIVSLTNGGVSVIDMSKNIIMQRFRNAVVKLGNNFEDYLRGIFGTSPSPDYHFPKFIVHKEVGVGGFDTQRTTADNQGYNTHQLMTTEETNDFAVEVDMPSVLIGISYFTVPVVYSQTKDRQFFHQNRFDFFNSMLQQIGDQVVYGFERSDLTPDSDIFGYQSRYNEYKQRLPIATGAFTSGNQLASWSFVIDSIFNPFVNVQVSSTQSPEYIRHHDYEFNRFFPSVAGYSLANGFHFIVTYNNKVVCNRPLEVNPNTL